MAKRVGCLIAGINSYPNLERGEQLDPVLGDVLKFAEADAKSFHQYVHSAWPGAVSHEPLLGSDVTLPKLHAAASAISAANDLDLCVWFFSGHASREGERTFFLTAESVSGNLTGLDAEGFDRLLGNVRSRTHLLLLDCCYAEGVLRASHFFTSLDDSVGRLYLCSSRSTQRTWEEERCGHGVFSAFLLDALQGLASDTPSSNAVIDVDQQLFPYVCDQVPLYVHQRKRGAAQEPVKGGVSRARVLLPVGRFDKLSGRKTTVLEAVIAWLWRMALLIVGASLAVFLFQHVFLFHADLGKRGNVILMPGVRELASLSGRLQGAKLDTGFTQAQFVPEAARIAGLYDGSIVGMWTHQTPRGYRSWINSFLTALSDSQRSRVTMRLTGELPPDFLARPPGSIQAWATQTVVDSLVLDKTPREKRMAWTVEAMRLSVNQPFDNGKPFDPNFLDFSVLNISDHELEGYLLALQNFALEAPDEAFPLFERMVQLTMQWNVHHREVGAEVKSRMADLLGRTLRNVGAARLHRRQPALRTEEIQSLKGLAEGGYGLWIAYPVAFMGASIAQDETRERLLSFLPPLDSSESIYLSPDQELALNALEHLSDFKPANDGFVHAVLSVLLARGYTFDKHPALTAFFLQAARNVRLPTDVVQALLDRAISPQGDWDSHCVDALEIVAVNAGFLDAGQKRLLSSRVAVVREREHDNAFILADLYGRLALKGLADARMADQIYSVAALPPPVSSADGTDAPEEVGMIIDRDDPGHAVALARYAQNYPVDEARSETLLAWAANENSPTEHREFLLGILHQRARMKAEAVSAERLLERIAAWPTDAARRTIEAELATEEVLEMPAEQQTVVLTGLKELRDQEVEPEVRIELSNVILDCSRRRVLHEAGFRD